MKRTAEQAPWILEKGHASKTIASTELLSTLLAVHLFVPVPEVPVDATTGVICCQGLTDNQSNHYVISKLMTTAFPSAAVLVQLTCMLSFRNLWLDLTWIPRLQNVEADALTNGDYSAFSMCNRVEVGWEQVPLEVMSEVL